MRDESGKFTKGNPGKPPGAKNKKSILWDQLGDFFVNEGAERFITEIRTLEGKDYVNAYSQLVEFFKPKLSRVETTDDLSREIDALTEEQAEDLLKQLSDKIINQWMQKVN